MPHDSNIEYVPTVVIGGGQAGLATGYHLGRRGQKFVILEGQDRIGDAWRRRWDSLRLFTPARFSALPGMRFPAPPQTFPTKDAFAEYLESYARHFELPVRTNVRVRRLSRPNGRFRIDTATGPLESSNVVVAMSNYQEPWIPPFADQLDPDIRQIHSRDYRNPAQLRPGPVLIVGAGNSGAEIARELAPMHQVWLSGRDVGQLPFRIDKPLNQATFVRLVLRFVFHRVLTVRTPLGRRARPKITSQGGPLIRVRRRDLEALGVTCVPKVAGVDGERPMLADGRVLDVNNVIWCTGYRPGFSWIDLPVHGEREPRHQSGVVASEPGLYFTGLHFLHALSSAMIHGVGRDAERIAGHIAEGEGG